MQEFAKFVKLRWEPSEGPYLKQGVKKNRTPKGAIRGSNGSFVMMGERAKLYLTVLTDDGRFVTQDIYYDVKDVTSKRITKKFREKLEDLFELSTFEVRNNTISNIEEILSAM